MAYMVLPCVHLLHSSTILEFFYLSYHTNIFAMSMLSLPVHLQWEKLGKLVENNRDQQLNHGAVKAEVLRADQLNRGAVHLDQPAPRLGVGDRHGLVQFSGGTRHRGNQKVHHSWLRSGCGT